MLLSSGDQGSLLFSDCMKSVKHSENFWNYEIMHID